MEDRVLLERFRAGEPDAVRVLYERYGGAVAALTRRALADAELAAEATQQTFVQAWRAAPTFDVTREPGPWLHAIARRVCIDLWRRERRRAAELSLEGGGVLDGASEAASLAVEPPSLERSWVTWEVRRALEELSAEDAELVRLLHVEQFSQAEVAERLGIPLGTVKSRSWRAHRRLARALGHLAPDRGRDDAETSPVEEAPGEQYEHDRQVSS